MAKKVCISNSLVFFQ